MRAPEFVWVWVAPRSGALVVCTGLAAGVVSFSGSGVEAEGGSGVGDPGTGGGDRGGGAALVRSGSAVGQGDRDQQELPFAHREVRPEPRSIRQGCGPRTL